MRRSTVRLPCIVGAARPRPLGLAAAASRVDATVSAAGARVRSTAAAAPGSEQPAWLARFNIELGSCRCDDTASQAIAAVSVVVRGHGVNMSEGVSGFLSSAVKVNAAALATSLDWLEVESGVHVTFAPLKDGFLSTVQTGAPLRQQWPPSSMMAP